MIIKLLLILSLFYGFTIHSQTNKGLESLEERGEFVFKLPGHFDIEGETNPKHFTRIMENCLLSVNIESNNSIKLVFLDTETVQKFLCDILGTKIVKIDDKFLFFSDGHHVFEYLKLLEINKEQVVFEYTNKFLWGTTILTTKGILNLVYK
jgi:hypothetical protein